MPVVLNFSIAWVICFETFSWINLVKALSLCSRSEWETNLPKLNDSLVELFSPPLLETKDSFKEGAAEYPVNGAVFLFSKEISGTVRFV